MTSDIRKERVREYMRKWRNTEKGKAYMKKIRSQNKEYQKEYQKNYIRKNPPNVPKRSDENWKKLQQLTMAPDHIISELRKQFKLSRIKK